MWGRGIHVRDNKLGGVVKFQRQAGGCSKGMVANEITVNRSSSRDQAGNAGKLGTRRKNQERRATDMAEQQVDFSVNYAVEVNVSAAELWAIIGSFSDISWSRNVVVRSPPQGKTVPSRDCRASPR